MPDLYSMMPRGASEQILPRDSSRSLRDRMADHQDAFDNSESIQRRHGSARMLVQVYDGGSIPSAAGKIYLTHPVIVTGNPTEGGSGTLTVDSSTTIPVLVLQSNPSAGDYLTIYAVSGRWVGETCPCGGGTSLPCQPSCSPTHTSMTATLSGCTSTPNPIPLPFLSGTTWRTASFTVAGGTLISYAIAFTCGSADGILPYQLDIQDGTSFTKLCSTLSACNPAIIGTPYGCITLASWTCSPFSATFTLPTGVGGSNSSCFGSFGGAPCSQLVITQP
jgi:hypothetical protein